MSRDRRGLGRPDLCLFDGSKGETAVISSAEDGILTLARRFFATTGRRKPRLAVLRKTALYLDAEQRVLRRKIDSSPAQPLLEDVSIVRPSSIPRTCLAEARLSLGSAPEESYALKILARNAALGKPR